MAHDTRPAGTWRRVLAASAALALVTLAVGVGRGGACAAKPAESARAPLRPSAPPTPTPVRPEAAALVGPPDGASAPAGTTPLEVADNAAVRVAVQTDDSYAHLARLDIVVRAEGRSVAGAIVALQGIGAVFPAPGTNVDGEDRPLTDRSGLASVYVRPMVTWHGAVATPPPRWVGEFVATSPVAGDTHTLEVELAPSIDARCVHLVVVSLPSGAPLSGVALRCETGAGAPRRAPDGSTEGVTDVDGRVVLCWPEDTTLRIEAKGHTVRRLTWADAQRPVEQLAHTNMAAAEASEPIAVEVATLGAVYGDSLPAWLGAGRVCLDVLQHPKSGESTRTRAGETLDGRGSWRIDEVPTWVGEGPERAFGGATEAPTFDVVWNGSGTAGGVQMHWVPLVPNVTLGPGEARHVTAPWRDEVVEVDLRVTIDGALAPSGTRLELVRRQPLTSADDSSELMTPAITRPSIDARTKDMRSQMRLRTQRDRLRLASTVEADGHVRIPALPPGTYDVTTFLQAHAGVAQQTLDTATMHRQIAACVLELSPGTPMSRVTGELALRRND